MTKPKYTYWKDGQGDVFRQNPRNERLQMWLILDCLGIKSDWGEKDYWKLEELKGRRRISADTARKMGVLI